MKDRDLELGRNPNALEEPRVAPMQNWGWNELEANPSGPNDTEVTDIQEGGSEGYVQFEGQDGPVVNVVKSNKKHRNRSGGHGAADHGPRTTRTSI